MNQASQVLTTLIHYNVAVRDTMEYCLNKQEYDVNLFKEKKRSVLVEVEEHTPLKDIIEHSGENGEKLEKAIREFYDEIYGDNSTVLHLAEDGLRVDHNQHLAIYKHVLPIHENVTSMIRGGAGVNFGEHSPEGVKLSAPRSPWPSWPVRTLP